PGDPEASLFPPDGGTGLWFQVVPEPKTIKNRVHLDLKPTGRTRDEETAHIQALGAAFIEDHRRPDGSGWVVLADPAGNEFCVLHSDAERAASGGGSAQHRLARTLPRSPAPRTPRARRHRFQVPARRAAVECMSGIAPPLLRSRGDQPAPCRATGAVLNKWTPTPLIGHSIPTP